jgi:rhodanese-related sulfurtransferase
MLPSNPTSLNLFAAAAWMALGRRDLPPDQRLARFETAIRRAFPDVATIAPAALEGLLEAGKGESVVLVDVRTPAEQAAGRISGARGLGAATVADSEGRTVVAYCAVGLRSARWVIESEAQARAAGARGICNLSGGVFRWVNEGRGLVAAGGGAGAAHPYGWPWRKFLLAGRGVVS